MIQRRRVWDRRGREVRTRVMLLLVVLVVNAVASGRAFAIGLTAGAQIGASRSDTAATEHFGWTVWARRANGTLTFKSDGAGRHYWVDPNPAPYAEAVVHPNGISATGFNRAGTVYERGFYAGNAPMPGGPAALWPIWEYRLVNGSHGGNIFLHTPPGNRVPTGHIAVSHRKNPDGMSTVLLYATFTDGSPKQCGAV